jgi:hypothetical protein
MAPNERKGEQSTQDAAAEERAKGEQPRQAGEESDLREEEGWSQPESSAQKGGREEPD